MSGQTEWVIVPKAALEWLNGAAPDPAGHWFGDFPEDHPKPRGAFWWRTTFKDICDYYERTFPKPAPAHIGEDDGTVAMMCGPWGEEGSIVWLEGCERLEQGDYLYLRPSPSVPPQGETSVPRKHVGRCGYPECGGECVGCEQGDAERARLTPSPTLEPTDAEVERRPLASFAPVLLEAAEVAVNNLACCSSSLEDADPKAFYGRIAESLFVLRAAINATRQP